MQIYASQNKNVWIKVKKINKKEQVLLSKFQYRKVRNWCKIVSQYLTKFKYLK